MTEIPTPTRAPGESTPESTARRAAPRPGKTRTAGPSAKEITAGVVLIVVVAFAIPVWITHASGALGIPRNDDWSYLLTLFHWVDSGHLDFNNWVSMTLLSQLAIAAPIVLLWEHNITLIQLLTATLGLAGLLSVMRFGYTVTRRFWFAVFVAVLVAAGPLWGPLSVSFMTDVPAFAVSMAACGLGVRALNRPRVSLPYFYASMTAGLIGFTIRQYAAAPLVAIVLMVGIMLWHEGSRPRIRAFLIATALFVLAALAFWAYWRTIPHPKAFSPAFPTGHSIRETVSKGGNLFRLLGLLVTPALILAGPGRIIRRSWAVAHDSTIFAGVGVVGGLALTGFAGPRIGFVGNYVVPDGVLSQGVASGHRPDLFPTGVFAALLVIGTLGAGLLAVAVVPMLHDLFARVQRRDLVPRDPVIAFLGVVTAGYGVAYFLAAFTGIPLYDRYVLPVVPIVALLLLRPAATAPEPHAVRSRRAARRRMLRALVALVVLGVVGLAYTIDSASFDGSRWKVSVAATHAGWAPYQVRGGFEWSHYYAFYTGNAKVDRQIEQANSCVVVVVNPPAGKATPGVIASGYYRPPFHKPVLVVARRTNRPCTPVNVKAAHP